jgi:hypothetical protein
MNRAQGMLLDPKGQVRFDSLGICIDSSAGRDGKEAWSGYFEPPSMSGVISGERFRLVLDDGRTQEIEIEYVESVAPQSARVLFRSVGPSP